MTLPVLVTGMTVSLGLIVAIGAQNAFVLRQGLRGEHVLAVCLACAASDAALIALGVGGFGGIAAALPWFDPAMRVGGAAFLAWYGARSFHAALFSRDALAAEGPAAARSLSGTLTACLAITWLNPHVYLDTVVLLGAVSTQFPDDRPSFALGAMLGSFLFFFSLGYGAAWLRPVFARPSSWRALEAIVALVMWTLALRLVLGG